MRIFEFFVIPLLSLFFSSKFPFFTSCWFYKAFLRHLIPSWKFRSLKGLLLKLLLRKVKQERVLENSIIMNKKGGGVTLLLFLILYFTR